MQPVTTATRRPATTAMALPARQQRRWRKPRTAAANTVDGPANSMLLPAYAAHRAQCQRDYAVLCNRFPTLSAVSAVSTAGPRHRQYRRTAEAKLGNHGNQEELGADSEDALWPSGFVTSLHRPTFGQQQAATAHQLQRYQQRRSQHLPAQHGLSRGRSLPHFSGADNTDEDTFNEVENFNDAASASTSSSAEADGVGRLRRRLRLDAWRLCDLLRRRGFGDPRQNHQLGDDADGGDGRRRQRRSGPRIREVRFHNHSTSVSGWFARRDLGTGVSAARPATLSVA